MNLQQRLTKGCKGCPFFVTLSGSHLPEFSRAKDDQSCLPKSGVFCNHFFSFLKPRSRTVLAKWGELNTHRNFETSCRVRCGKERNCFCMSFFSWLLLIVKTCQNNMQRKHCDSWGDDCGERSQESQLIAPVSMGQQLAKAHRHVLGFHLKPQRFSVQFGAVSVLLSAPSAP